MLVNAEWNTHKPMASSDPLAPPSIPATIVHILLAFPTIAWVTSNYKLMLQTSFVQTYKVRTNWSANSNVYSTVASYEDRGNNVWPHFQSPLTLPKQVKFLICFDYRLQHILKHHGVQGYVLIRGRWCIFLYFIEFLAIFLTLKIQFGYEYGWRQLASIENHLIGTNCQKCTPWAKKTLQFSAKIDN